MCVLEGGRKEWCPLWGKLSSEVKGNSTLYLFAWFNFVSCVYINTFFSNNTYNKMIYVEIRHLIHGKGEH